MQILDKTIFTNRGTRERILEAAIKVFAGKGYHDAHIEEIAAASKSSKGAVYFYFPSKEQVFLALVDEFARLLEKRLLAAMLQQTNGINQVDAALVTVLETFGQYRSLAKIILVQAVGLGAAFEEKRLEVHQRFILLVKGFLDGAIAQGEIPPQDSEIAAYAWMGAINEVVIRWIHTGHPTPERALPGLRTILLRSIGVAEERIKAQIAESTSHF